MNPVRPPAVAGLFYPREPRALRTEVEQLLGAAAASDTAPPVAIIAPHAGYIYSGPIAASAYARVRALRARVHRVVLLGPAHRVALRGIACASADYFETPLGQVPVDSEALARLTDLPQVSTNDDAHAGEHSLEVHLPFLQVLFDDFKLVPLVVGQASPAEVGEVIERLWDGPETLIVVSSDLSHYHPYSVAQRLDRATSAAIEQLRYEDLGYDDACGRVPVSGLLHVARRRGLTVQTVDLRNSGDTAGPRHEVVGYGAYVLH